jgi:hypothetical protein
MATAAIAPIILLAPFVFTVPPLPGFRRLPFKLRGASEGEATKHDAASRSVFDRRCDYMPRWRHQRGLRGFAEWPLFVADGAEWTSRHREAAARLAGAGCPRHHRERAARWLAMSVRFQWDARAIAEASPDSAAECG